MRKISLSLDDKSVTFLNDVKYDKLARNTSDSADTIILAVEASKEIQKMIFGRPVGKKA